MTRPTRQLLSEINTPQGSDGDFLEILPDFHRGIRVGID